MKEMWKPIVGFEKYYEVSSLGNVRSTEIRVRSGWAQGYRLRKSKILYQTTHPTGYKKVTLSKNSKLYTRSVHKLMLEAFVPNPEKRTITNHIDGNKQNNILENLEWSTYLENQQKASKIGLYKSGEKHYKTKLTEEKAREIKIAVKEYQDKRNTTLKKLAKKFDVPLTTIANFNSGSTWKHLKI